MSFWAAGFWVTGFWADGFWAEESAQPGLRVVLRFDAPVTMVVAMTSAVWE